MTPKPTDFNKSSMQKKTNGCSAVVTFESLHKCNNNSVLYLSVLHQQPNGQIQKMHEQNNNNNNYYCSTNGTLCTVR
jgi:hypothetical protein